MDEEYSTSIKLIAIGKKTKVNLTTRFLDFSAGFWEQFDVQNKKLKKQVSLFEFENIDKSNVITIALNPKEHYKRFNDRSANKKT